jgi:nucleotidyltransferase/DNA polymerase involved in DNA repair
MSIFNSYFASVEQQLQPELRGKPIAVVPVETDSTSPIAASYEAKAFGVKPALPRPTKPGRGAHRSERTSPRVQSLGPHCMTVVEF